MIDHQQSTTPPLQLRSRLEQGWNKVKTRLKPQQTRQNKVKQGEKFFWRKMSTISTPNANPLSRIQTPWTHGGQPRLIVSVPFSFPSFAYVQSCPDCAPLTSSHFLTYGSQMDDSKTQCFQGGSRVQGSQTHGATPRPGRTLLPYATLRQFTLHGTD